MTARSRICLFNIVPDLNIDLHEFEEEPHLVVAHAHHPSQRVIVCPPEVVDDRLLVIDHCSARGLLECPNLQSGCRSLRAECLLNMREQISGKGGPSERRKSDRKPDGDEARIDGDELSRQPLKEQGIRPHVGMKALAEPSQILKNAVQWMS